MAYHEILLKIVSLNKTVRLRARSVSVILFDLINIHVDVLLCTGLVFCRLPCG